MKVEFIIRNDENFKYFNGFENGKAIFVNGSVTKTLNENELYITLNKLVNQGYKFLSVKAI